MLLCTLFLWYHDSLTLWREKKKLASCCVHVPNATFLEVFSRLSQPSPAPQSDFGGKGCLLVFLPQTITRTQHERAARDAVEAALGTEMALLKVPKLKEVEPLLLWLQQQSLNCFSGTLRKKKKKKRYYLCFCLPPTASGGAAPTHVPPTRSFPSKACVTRDVISHQHYGI